MVFKHFDLERSEIYKIAVLVTDVAILAYTKGLFLLRIHC